MHSLLLPYCYLLGVGQTKKTIIQITGVNLDRCQTINNEGPNIKLNTKDFKKVFKNKKVKNSLENTSHETLKCYDENNKVLFFYYYCK